MSMPQGTEQSHLISTAHSTSHTALQLTSSMIADTGPSDHSPSTHPTASSGDVIERMFDDLGDTDPLLTMDDAFGDIGSEVFPSANTGAARTAPAWNTGGGEKNTDADVQSSSISSRPFGKNPSADQVNQVDPFDGSGVQRERVGGRARLVKHKSKRPELEDGHDEPKQEGLEDAPDYSKTQGRDGDKGADVKHSPSSGKTIREEDDNVEEDYDLREPVARFDSKKELVDKWDAIQAEMVPELKKWAEESLENSLTMIYSVVHLFHLEAAKAETALRQGVEAIEAEEKKHCKLKVFPLLASRIDDTAQQRQKILEFTEKWSSFAAILRDSAQG